MSEKQSFWSTLPGIIAGIAATLTGLATIIAFVMGGFGGLTTPADEPASPEATSSPDSPGTSGSSDGSGSERIEPQAVIAPKTIDFGSVSAGSQAQESVTVVNSGNEYLVVDDASVSGDQDAFSVEAEDCLVAGGIEPQDECEIVVTFGPASQGSYAGVLQIEHSGPTSPNQVALSGQTRLLGL